MFVRDDFFYTSGNLDAEIRCWKLRALVLPDVSWYYLEQMTYWNTHAYVTEHTRVKTRGRKMKAEYGIR